MTIKRFNTEKAPTHCNPVLEQGQTYRIIEVRSDYSRPYLGRYFVAFYCAGDTYLVYLQDTKYRGGRDTLGVIERLDIKFVRVDLAEA